MRIAVVAIAVLGLAAFIAPPACAGLLITIDKSQQRMIVAKDDSPLYDWPISTGLRNYDTPAGVYKPFRMEAEHFSREWDDAPMPHSIFFTEIGHAIHGSLDVKRLGRPASHGCVRLSPEHATILFKLVRAEKMANTRVLLTGDIPGGATPAHALSRDPYAADEALAGWQRPAPAFAEDEPRREKHERTAGTERSRPRQSPRAYYVRPRTLADMLGLPRN